MKSLRALPILSAVILYLIAVTLVSADGTETLGTPSLQIQPGSGVVVGGTGLINQPGTINVDVPAGATVEQALLYWEGQFTTTGDDTITVNGTPVTGTQIGGPTTFFQNAIGANVMSASYRADITSLDLVTDGSNALTIAGLENDHANNGAGLMVIYDDGSAATIGIRDGNDLAFRDFAPTLDNTVAQTFSFDPADIERTADLNMFFSSVSGSVSGHGSLRPTVIEITVDSTTAELTNALDSTSGEEWDTLTAPVTIPAGASQLTVQAFSRDDSGTSGLPASFAWTAAALSVPNSSPSTTLTPTPSPTPPGQALGSVQTPRPTALGVAALPAVGGSPDGSSSIPFAVIFVGAGLLAASWIVWTRVHKP